MSTVPSGGPSYNREFRDRYPEWLNSLCWFMLGFAPHLLLSCLFRIPFWSLTLPEVLRHLSQVSWFHQDSGMVIILLKKVSLKPYSSHQWVGQMAHLAAQVDYPFLYLIFPTWNRSIQETDLGLWIPVGSSHLILKHWALQYFHHFIGLAVTGENLSKLKKGRMQKQSAVWICMVKIWATSTWQLVTASKLSQSENWQTGTGKHDQETSPASVSSACV